MLFYSAMKNASGMRVVLRFPKLREQRLKAVGVLQRQNNKWFSRIDAQLQATAKNGAGLLELLGDAPGLLLAGIADHREMGTGDFDPGSVRTRSGPSQDAKKTVEPHAHWLILAQKEGHSDVETPTRQLLLARPCTDSTILAIRRRTHVQRREA